MIAATSLIAIALAVTAQGAATSGPESRCAGMQPRPAGNLGPPGARRLDLLPPAQHVLTVFRTVDGCLAPVVVRSNIGADRNPAPPR